MEVNAVSLPHHSDVSTHSQPTDDETGDHTSIQSSQRQMKHISPSDQWTKMQEQVSMLKRENTRLIQEKKDLRVDLEEFKNDFFRRMPPTQISDNTIQKALERIRASIDGFVFEVMGGVADDALYILCLRNQKKPKKRRRKSHNPLSRFIKNEDIRLWGPFECSNFYILSVIIQWILDDFVFKNEYPMGITREHTRVLEEVAEGMWHAKKQDRLDVWRSETLIALTALPENDARLERISKGICKRLNDILSPWLIEAGPFANVEETFRRNILDPAIKLHQDLKSSSHRYGAKTIKFFDRLSPKQMLDEWDLKDADTWQKPKGEKDVGKALYCLHPQTVRLRDKGTAPIVIAKPVIVVTSSERERISNQRGSVNSLLSDTATPPAAINSNPGTPTKVKFADSPSMLFDDDSSTGSSHRPLHSHQRRASTHPLTQKQEYPSPSFQRRQSVPVVLSYDQEDRPRQSNFHLEGETQSSGRPREDKDVPAYTRGHPIPGNSLSYRSQGAIRQPSRRPSRDPSNGRGSPRRPANDNSQPPVAPSTSVPSTASSKARIFKELILGR